MKFRLTNLKDLELIESDEELKEDLIKAFKYNIIHWEDIISAHARYQKRVLVKQTNKLLSDSIKKWSDIVNNEKRKRKEKEIDRFFEDDLWCTEIWGYDEYWDEFDKDWIDYRLK